MRVVAPTPTENPVSTLVYGSIILTEIVILEIGGLG